MRYVLQSWESTRAGGVWPTLRAALASSASPLLNSSPSLEEPSVPATCLCCTLLSLQVMDMCASPGSKTAQLLEALHQGDGLVRLLNQVAEYLS